MTRRRLFVIRGLKGLARGRVEALGDRHSSNFRSRNYSFRGVFPELRNGHGWMDWSDAGSDCYSRRSLKVGRLPCRRSLTATGSLYPFWGGYSKTFPPGRYTTTIDIYLDISPPT